MVFLRGISASYLYLVIKQSCVEIIIGKASLGVGQRRVGFLNFSDAGSRRCNVRY
jgi:hypothetical protein